MRLLHTSDWHLGRTFFTHSTLEALESVFDAVVEVVQEQQVDVVLAAGDIYDSSTPSADAVQTFNRILAKLHATGATLVLTSGNHDSATRLGSMAAFAAEAGVHVLTDPSRVAEPVTVHDEHGPVHVYGIPFLEPARLRHQWPEPMRSQKDAIGHAMGLVADDLATRGGRSVVLAHTFVAGAAGESCESERDIVSDTTVGGVDLVPVPTFDGVDYAALGHIHGRATLAEHVRYSGAPLHYSFSEADKPRGAWLVDLDASGLQSVAWVGLPVPRELVTLTGTLEELLAESSYEAHVDKWVDAVLTDDTRPMDAMRKLQARFPHCAHLDHRPARVHDDGATSYSERVRGKSDGEIVDAFLAHVRNGEGATAAEVELIDDVVAAHAGVGA